MDVCASAAGGDRALQASRSVDLGPFRSARKDGIISVIVKLREPLSGETCSSYKTYIIAPHVRLRAPGCCEVSILDI